MIQAGILGESDPVELLQGWIVPKMPRSPEHDALISWCRNRVITPRLPAGWFCRVQSAIEAPDSEPKPDLAVVRGSERDYRRRHPGPGDAALVIGFADSSLARDHGLKAEIDAAAGVPFYGIVNLVHDVVEVHSDPTGPAPTPSYRDRVVLGRNDLVRLVIDGQDLGAIPVTELLP
jgi:Uma2 family endonuclease